MRFSILQTEQPVIGVSDPVTGVRFVELSHPWGHGVPIIPGDADVHIERAVYHARDGVLSQKIVANMHVSTHLNAPIHLIQRGAYVGQVPIDRLFGSGVIVSIPKGRWELIEALDLAAAAPAIEAGDIVLLVTGWHAKFDDSQEYFGEAPGLSAGAAQWLIDREVNLVGIDTPFIDHPLATSMSLHRNGPLMRRLPQKFQAETGHDPKEAYPDWNPAHKLLLHAGIPTIENVGGDVAHVTGTRCTLHALPWRWMDGDACVIRLMGLFDDAGSYRIEAGAPE